MPAGLILLRVLTVLALLAPGFAWAAGPEDSAKPAPANTQGGAIVTIDPATRWAPRNGHVRVIVEGTSTIGLAPVACFRWSGESRVAMLRSRRVEMVESDQAAVPPRTIYQVTVPPRLPLIRSWWPMRLIDSVSGTLGQEAEDPQQFENGATVPIAHLRFLLLAQPHEGPCNTIRDPLVDETRDVGITSVGAAAVISVLMAGATMLVLAAWATARKIPGDWAPMRLICTRYGYASLSQLQIMLWSFLIGAGAIYVMVLSGSLIDIPARALTLLGIAGVSTVGAKIHGANQAAAAAQQDAPPAATAANPPGPVQNLRASGQSDDGVALSWDDPASGDKPQAYRVEVSRKGMADWRVAAPAVTGKSIRVSRLRHAQDYTFQVFAYNGAGTSQPVPVDATTLAAEMITRRPQWADLVVTPEHPGEIDVTRVQMLFFTLISAAFVAVKLFTSYTIPDIPDGFMLLMGISNGVYLTAKFVPD